MDITTFLIVALLLVLFFLYWRWTNRKVRKFESEFQPDESKSLGADATFPTANSDFDPPSKTGTFQ